jgi:hypothetical protein
LPGGAWTLADGNLLIHLAVREQAVVDDESMIPVLRREPLRQAGNKVGMGKPIR